MSLNLSKAALGIDQMALRLRERQDDHRRRLGRALEVLASFDVAGSRRKRLASKATMPWNVPAIEGSPGTSHTPPHLPKDFCVTAVDGSHIAVDRHIPARCFLINIGVAALSYGSQPDASLFNEPRLYATDDELVIRDRAALHLEQAIEGAVMGAKRAVEEIRALVQVVRDLSDHIPTLALIDGSLIMLGLVGQGIREFVLRELIDDGFVPALEELRRMSEQRPLAVASYISLPRSAEVAGALRLEVCPYETADCGRYCGTVTAGQRPCDEAAEGLMDRHLFWELLEPGERSAVFNSPSPLVESRYGGHQVRFFYVHAGEEIGRVEVPQWVAERDDLLGLTHAAVIDQCRRGPGYPVALMEAHEQAVITGANRQQFVQLVEGALQGQRVPTYSSQKSISKRIRWL